MNLLDILEEEIVYLDCSCKKKEDVIHEYIRFAAQKTGKVLDEEKLFKAVTDRENIENSGVGHELAIIHCRGDFVKDIIVMIAICEQGVDFGSKDKSLVKILFLVAASEENNREYLTILAKISKMFRDSELKKEILEAKNQKEIMRIIKNWSN